MSAVRINASPPAHLRLKAEILLLSNMHITNYLTAWQNTPIAKAEAIGVLCHVFNNLFRNCMNDSKLFIKTQYNKIRSSVKTIYIQLNRRLLVNSSPMNVRLLYGIVFAHTAGLQVHRSQKIQDAGERFPQKRDSLILWYREKAESANCLLNLLTVWILFAGITMIIGCVDNIENSSLTICILWASLLLDDMILLK